jgi:hypothetical protein
MTHGAGRRSGHKGAALAKGVFMIAKDLIPGMGENSFAIME